MAAALLDEIMGSAKIPQDPDDVVPLPSFMMPQKEKVQIKKEITETIELLKGNPPVDPSQLRKISIYRNNLKIIKMQVKGANIRNKSLNLRPFNSSLSRTDERLKSSWQIFRQEDVDKIRLTKIFMAKIDQIKTTFTHDAKRFGVLIKTSNKVEFTKKIQEEVHAFTEAMTSEDKQKKLAYEKSGNKEKI